MSKPTTLKANLNSNAKSTGTKHREPSKDTTGLRKPKTSIENVNVPLASVKSKPSIKAKESPSNTTVTKKITKNDSNKTDSKSKLKIESHRSVINATDKSSPKINQTMPTTASKSSLLPHQSSLTKMKRSSAPETPPSSRVTKTQYFPTKKMYSNAVKELGNSKPDAQRRSTNSKDVLSSKERSKTRTLDHSEIKIVKNKTEVTKTSEKSKVLKDENKMLQTEVNNDFERPRTATLKRGSIVNSNIAGPDIPKSETPSLTSLDLSYDDTKQEDEYDYEDDFESYESDFEEYLSSGSTSTPTLSSSDDENLHPEEETTTSEETSLPPKQKSLTGTDEERMLDSGNFDLPDNKHKQLLDDIKESSEQKNYTIEFTENSRSNMASLSDEGFEDGKSSLQSGNMQFINFADAQKKWKQNKHLEKRRKRGEEILNMIRLDHYNFTLIDMPSVTYDIFIKSYGKTNTIQVPTQTGDDDTSEEIQTDVIETTNKWTQFPISFSKIDSTNSNYLEIYKREFVGVGNDYDVTTNSTTKQDIINYKRFESFLLFSGQIILTLLEESLHKTQEQIHKNPREIPFSSGYIKFDTNLCAFLKNRPITFVSYCSTTNIQILTVHGRNKEAHENVEDEFSLKSIVCIWNILNSKEPEKMLVITGELSYCCFILEMKSLIFGGLCDGAITTWSMSEDNQVQVFNDIWGNNNHIQEPNYTTEIGCGHSSRVVSIQPLINNADSLVLNSFDWKSSSDQICSLEEDGTLIIWGVIRRNNFSFNMSIKQTAMPWGRISLVQNSRLFLKDFNPDLTDLLCTDMNINVMDPHHLFISTNYGYVLHCLVTGTKATPKKYNPGTMTKANCLEMCPFSPLYFFAGHEDGTVVLYSRLLEKPLMIMSNKDDILQSGIQLLQWSYDKPCIFYAKDRCNTLHIWDLTISDLYPTYSVPFKENIICMKLSPTLLKNNDTSYLLLATENGSIHLHVLNAEYGSSNLDQYQQDMNKFLNYVNRL